ncbi:hypothetical protein [Campylobacter geochelonis]|uniref:hypothetical protein n=1 Tax=Campylobacter geochelonis TaxID=1780362 RepID=UPI000770AD29|nr:hypothetical protein [Campylobacter geochelonis]CZE47909.1 tail protein D [Campylobacter geochelonis]CZE50812.1 tail protein D [Campylobacter geochelonis]
MKRAVELYKKTLYLKAKLEKSDLDQWNAGGRPRNYTQKIAQPEAYRVAESKLNELQRGGVSGRLECGLRELKAGGKLVLGGVDGYEDVEFSIKSVSHRLSPATCSSSVEFEG